MKLNESCLLYRPLPPPPIPRRYPAIIAYWYPSPHQLTELLGGRWKWTRVSVANRHWIKSLWSCPRAGLQPAWTADREGHVVIE